MDRKSTTPTKGKILKLKRCHCKYGFVKKCWYNVFWVLPEESRRMIMVGSVLGLFCPTQEERSKAAKAINERLNLHHTPSAIIFPALFARFIWGKIGTEGNVERLVIRLLNRMPLWLSYGSMCQRHSDLSMTIMMLKGGDHGKYRCGISAI